MRKMFCSRKFILIAIGLLALFWSVNHYLLYSQGNTAPGEVWARVGYGSEDNQIGIVPAELHAPEQGPTAIYVDAAKNVFYVADQVNCKVKEFNKSGSLIMVTEGKMINLHFFAVVVWGTFMLHMDPEWTS